MTQFSIFIFIILFCFSLITESVYTQTLEKGVSSIFSLEQENNLRLTDKKSDRKFTLDKFNEGNSYRNLHTDKYSSKSLQLIAILTGSYLQPLNDLSGNLSSVSLTNPVTSSKSYFEKWGYNYGIEIKLPVSNKDNMRITFTMLLNYFSNSGNDSSGFYIIEPKLKSIQTGIGIEYAIPITKKFNTFISAGLTSNIFYGSIDFYTNSMALVSSMTYNPNTRFGVEGGSGLEYSIIDKLGIVAGIKYNLANIIGKEYDNTGAHDLDDESFVISGETIKSKTISFLRIYLGLVMYYFD